MSLTWGIICPDVVKMTFLTKWIHLLAFWFYHFSGLLLSVVAWHFQINHVVESFYTISKIIYIFDFYCSYQFLFYFSTGISSSFHSLFLYFLIQSLQLDHMYLIKTLFLSFYTWKNIFFFFKDRSAKYHREWSKKKKKKKALVLRIGRSCFFLLSLWLSGLKHENIPS